MKKIPSGYIVPSAAYTLKKGLIHGYSFLDKKPEPGDLVYGKVVRLGHHSNLENRNGRHHIINPGSRAIFVYGNRYAPDHYEGVVPDHALTEVDMLALSGIVGELRCRNSSMKDPTRIRILGYVCSKDEKPINTRAYPLIIPAKTERKSGKRSKMILVVGTSMNSGKSMAAATCCWALSTMGYQVRGSKITGTASLKDILRMNDAGATVYNDFTHFGYPSTYLLSNEELLRIFNHIDLKYCNQPNNYWVVEIADGILQRETAMLLESEVITSRIHKLVLCAGEALGCIGSVKLLKERFGLVPDAISGKLSSSPLARQELEQYCSIPVFDNLARELDYLAELVL